jgi:hypothetical protein
MSPIQTIKAHDIEWDIIPLQERGFNEPHKKHGNQLNSYCCDGEGIVQVYEYELGVFRVFDQLTYRGDYKSLNDALAKAVKILKKDYFAIYEMQCI